MKAEETEVEQYEGYKLRPKIGLFTNRGSYKRLIKLNFKPNLYLMEATDVNNNPINLLGKAQKNAWLIFLLLGSMLITVSSCNEKEEPVKESIGEQDRNFAVLASYSNQAEIAFGQLALSKAGNELVREFAQTMIKEYTNAQDKLRYLSETYDIEIPDTVDNEQRVLYRQMSEMKDYSLDSFYISNQIETRQKAQQIFQDQQDKGDNSEIVEYASSVLPHIQDHLEIAKALKKGLTPDE